MTQEHNTRQGAIRAPGPGMTVDQWLGVGSVYEALVRSGQRYGDKTAITFLATALDEAPRRVSHRELADSVARAANALRALGARRGAAVAYMLPSLPETQYVLWGAETAACALPLNPLLSVDDLAGLCVAAGARVLVALGPLPGTDVWDKAVQVKEKASGLDILVQVGGPPVHARPDVRQFDGLLATQPTELVFGDLPQADDVAAYFHTGGTTGTPKLAIHTHRNQLAAAMGNAFAMEIGPDDVVLNGLPMFHVAGPISCGLSMLVAGAEVVLLTAAGMRNPEVVKNYWRIIERTGATLSCAVPTGYAAAVQVDATGADLSTLRANSCGASLLPRSVATRMEQITRKPVHEAYGMTEAGGVIAVEHASHERVLGSAGHAIPFCEIQVRPLESGVIGAIPCEAGDRGALVVRGPNITPGYKDARHTAQLFTPDGWLITGDVAYLEADGRLFITGRSKDLIIRSGHNIDPSAIEDCLMRHPAVSAAAAVGMPDAYAGEVPVAFVTLRKGHEVAPEDLIEFCRSGVEGPAVPRKVFALERLPLTGVGKVFKPELRIACAQSHLEEVLKHEPVESCRVREAPGKGLVARVRLTAAAMASDESRHRIADALGAYLLQLEWDEEAAASRP